MLKTIPIVAGRSCDKCTACCEGWLWGNAFGFEFKPGTPCRFVKKSGCSIYEARPYEPCQTFLCHWKSNPVLPDWMRPDLSGVIVLVRYLDDLRYLVLHSTGRRPDDRLIPWADSWAESGGNLIYHAYDGIKYFSKNAKFIDAMEKRQ